MGHSRTGLSIVIAIVLTSLAGPVGASAAGASPSTVTFGDVPLNTTVTRDVTITVDAGQRTTTASGTGITAPFSFAFNTCGAGGGFTGPGTCTVKQSYKPTALTASSATTNVFQCPVAGGGCTAIPYTMTGTGVSVASASPALVNFGDVAVGETATRDVTVTVDAGQRVTTASGTGISAPFAFAFDTCATGGGFTGPGTCIVKQSFKPTVLTGSSGTTSVSQCPVGGGGCLTIPYRSFGTGVPDGTAPVISIASPGDTTYTLNQVVTASYSCADAASAVSTCAGPVASGAPIDTSTPGTHTFTVRASDTLGNSAVQDRTYRVVDPPVAPAATATATADRTKPILASLKFSAAAFQAARSRASASAKAKKKAPVGTKVTFSLSEPGTVKFTFERSTKGRRPGKKCVAKTKRNAKKKSCTRWVALKGTFAIPGKAGRNSFTFRGRLAGKSLKAGSYRLNSQATDVAANRSAIKRKSFKIVKH